MFLRHRSSFIAASSLHINSIYTSRNIITKHTILVCVALLFALCVRACVRACARARVCVCVCMCVCCFYVSTMGWEIYCLFVNIRVGLTLHALHLNVLLHIVFSRFTTGVFFVLACIQQLALFPLLMYYV